MRLRLSILGLISAAILWFAPQTYGQEAKPAVVVGTGGLSGVYYPVGKALCDMLNRGRAMHGLSCRADSTGGSVDNIERLRSGQANVAIVQSDILYYAVNGYGPFKDKGPDAQLRAIVALHPETFTVLARADSGIRTLEDLPGKRINIGNPGSGQNTFFGLVMKVMGWTPATFLALTEKPADEQAAALCAGEVDAIVFVAGHPNAAIKSAASNCATNLVDIHNDPIDKLVSAYPYFSASVIPGDKYPGSPTAIHSFGVYAVLATRADVADDTIGKLTQVLFNGFSDLKFSHPALSSLTPQGMVQPTPASAHPAVKAFVEQSTDLGQYMQISPAKR